MGEILNIAILPIILIPLGLALGYALLKLQGASPE
ncbi:MAG: PetM of cytochrome b6f complex subunit 7 [Alkalinema sp. CAN_BIN05]|nr:PetM of cytochrome b6f complex subunit 7 [Alkalinema sp. CAN_BIN05]